MTHQRAPRVARAPSPASMPVYSNEHGHAGAGDGLDRVAGVITAPQPTAAPLDFDACDDEGRPFGLESFHTL
eukprot:CAMPEP_0182605706 /NCGR_PEP_ID=MMETSP1330-20130603/655_1 /TAXON_ID=464278 /ORGANISM="Picochlorum sp., Strain RCC944" /LENGTH=71 /DNA_ID=CAMNT_0024823783 /DNA_START=97 /DNA_END=313 /DNA_ORIENTATION=+